MATIKVQNFTVRSVVDGTTIVLTTFADGLSVKESKYSIPSYTVASAEADAIQQANTFGVLGPNNENFYEKDNTQVPPPQPEPQPIPETEKDTSLNQPRYIPETRYAEPKSTRGGEYVNKKTGEDYIGQYIESFDGKYYAGTSPQENGYELVKVNEEFPIGLAFATAPIIAGLLAGFFKPKIKKGDKEKGVTKRFFVQDKKTNKIQETDQQTYIQAKVLPNTTLATVDWVIKGPAEDKIINGYPFEGAASKNKKTIQALEKQMPGISTIITDYSFLVQDPTSTQKSVLSTTVEVERDRTTELENLRKASFDLRK